MNVQRQQVITHLLHLSIFSLHHCSFTVLSQFFTQNSLTLSVPENNMRFSSIVLLLGAVSCTLAARTPATPTNGAVRDANKGIASPSPVPVENGKGVASTPASSKSPSPTGDPKKDNKDVTDTEKLEPFDGKPSIPYKPKPFQCEC